MRCLHDLFLFFSVCVLKVFVDKQCCYLLSSFIPVVISVLVCVTFHNNFSAGLLPIALTLLILSSACNCMLCYANEFTVLQCL